ncbi:MAG: carbon-nitrogen hydrolase family protein [Magnetococcales bacterium]|nr:carbon-nitrogen hydrolase family protein [Magnetococcales bacterium]
MAFRTGVIQLNSGADRQKNLTDAALLMQQAVERGAQMLVLPENFSFQGQSEADKRHHAETLEDSPSLDFLRDFSSQQGVWIVGGSIPLVADDAHLVTNSCFVVDNQGAIQGRYDKIHLFDVNLGGRPFRESSVIQPGNQVVVVDTPWGKLGLTICYDLRFPELFRALVDAGAQMIAVPAAFTLNTGRDHWELLLRARAVENLAWVFASDQWGKHPGGRSTYGHSMVVEPWGTVVGRCSDGVGITVVDVDLGVCEVSRKKIPCLDHRVGFLSGKQ